MSGKILEQKPLISIDKESLYAKGISDEDVRRFIPGYISSATLLEVNVAGRLFLGTAHFLISSLIDLFLRPRKGTVGSLEREEVDAVYSREARTYNQKHHLTTRGQDTVWRRQAGYFVLNYALNNKKGGTRVLDLCTGTGLTIKEIMNVMRLCDEQACLTGLDYNLEMLAIAKQTIEGGKKVSVDFVRGDATNMVSLPDTGHDFVKFEPYSFDAITQVFGIGGVRDPLKVFAEVLQLLKENGCFFLIDVHRPISSLPGEWPFLGRWLKSPLFEISIYQEVSIPLALNRLWAWRDATALFYLIRLITVIDPRSGRYYGFKVICFEYEPQRWWFSLPIMPVARIMLEKTEITKREAETRQQILLACSL